MQSWTSEGVILKRKDLGEADRLLTIFTKRRGKVKALAKGVRKVSSRRAGNVELLNYSKLFFSEGKSFSLLNEAEAIDVFSSIKEDLTKISYAYQVAEVVDSLFEEGQASRETFELLFETLKQIDESSDVRRARLFAQAFEVKILELSGYRPQLFTCPRCRQPLEEQTHLLSPELGGIVNRSCISESVLTRPVSSSGIKLLRFLQEEDLSRVGKIAVKDLVQKEIDQALDFYLEYLLEKALRSREFVAKVESL